jgi:hypothetical protein
MKKALFALPVLAFAFSLGIGVINPVKVSAAADSCTWTGGGDNATFADAANWTGCDNSNVPEAGDTIIFQNTTDGTTSLENDLGVAFAAVTAKAATSGSNSAYFSIDTLTLANNGTIDSTDAKHDSSDTFLSIASLTGQGALTMRGEQHSTSSNAIAGTLTLTDAASIMSNGNDTQGIIIHNGSILFLVAGAATNSTGTYPITLGGGSSSEYPEINFGAYNSEATTWNLANPLTLTHDALFSGDENITVNQSGSIDGVGFDIILSDYMPTSSVVNFNPSSNNSNVKTGELRNSNTETTSDEAAEKAPDTGFAFIGMSPLQTLGITALSAGALFFISRRVLAKSGVRR